MVLVEEVGDLRLGEPLPPALTQHVLISVRLTGYYRAGRSWSLSLHYHLSLGWLLLLALDEVRRLVQR